MENKSGHSKAVYISASGGYSMVAPDFENNRCPMYSVSPSRFTAESRVALANFKALLQRLIVGIQKQLQRFFHWKFSQAFVLLWVGSGVRMARSNNFIGAYVLVVLGGVWGLLCLLASERATKIRKVLKSRHLKRRPEVLEEARCNNKLLVWGGCLVIATLTASAAVWVYSVQFKYEMNEARRFSGVGDSVAVPAGVLP